MLTQIEADRLFQLPKKPRSANKLYDFPEPGGKLILEFVTDDAREEFLADITRGSIELKKCSYNTRARKIYPLRRLDLAGSLHQNPDVDIVPLSFLEPYNGVTIDCPHLHIYVEGFGAKWAIPAPQELCAPDTDIYDIMQRFLEYCNVDPLPSVQKGLFI
jgi:hypothetical protein